MRMAQINSWNTGTPVTKAKKTMKSMPNKEFLNKLLIAMNLHQHVQGQAISSIYSRHVWFKNLVIWLAERILAHISRTRFFLTMGIVKGNIKQYTFIIEQIQKKSITKFFNKLKKKTYFLPILEAKTFFKKSGTTSNEFLTLCQNSLKKRHNPTKEKPKKN